MLDSYRYGLLYQHFHAADENLCITEQFHVTPDVLVTEILIDTLVAKLMESWLYFFLSAV